jgi:hypothetical protein
LRAERPWCARQLPPAAAGKIVVIAAATAVVKPVSNGPTVRGFQSRLSNGMENHGK